MGKYPFKILPSHEDYRVGLIGSGIQESRSPLMHMREAQAQGFSLDYQLFDLEQLNAGTEILASLLDDIEAAGYSGLNITHPCKQAVIRYLDELSGDAAVLGAVNTVLFRDGKRLGHNTDWSGFTLGFESSLPSVDIDRVLLLGAGGAGSAVAYAMAKTGVKSLYIYDLESDKANTLSSRLSDTFPETAFIVPELIDDLIKKVDGIINTTPVGMKKYPGIPLNGDILSHQLWIADVIYFPIETELLRLARSIGCKTMDGSSMAINQAAEAFRLFTGKKANADRMAQTFFREF